MQVIRELLKRFWSLALVFILPAVELFAERFSWYPDWGIARAILSAVCIALLIHSWFMQRRSVKSRWRLTFWTLVLLFFALEFLWLALNSIRGPNYPDDFTAPNRVYRFAVEWQDRCVISAEAIAAIVGLWIAIDLIRWLDRRWLGTRRKTGSVERNAEQETGS